VAPKKPVVAPPPKQTISASDYFATVKVAPVPPPPPFPDPVSSQDSQMTQSQSQPPPQQSLSPPPSPKSKGRPIEPIASPSRSTRSSSSSTTVPIKASTPPRTKGNDNTPPALEKGTPTRTVAAKPAATSERPPLIRKKSDEEVARELQAQDDAAVDRARRRR
jgi:hypothetical protein